MRDMGPISGQILVAVVVTVFQVLVSATPNDDKFEPMVAFICGKPAMHRGVNGWISDEKTHECWDDKSEILNYCKNMYPNHNITNVVEAAYLVTIPGWPSLHGKSTHTHRVRPFRCIVGAFQSDALLVPQQCVFDHQHYENMCRNFSHWEKAAQDACVKKGKHCESFGMLLNCGLSVFSGVEYVCCPDKTQTNVHPNPPEPIEEGADDTDDDDDEEDDEYSDEDDEDEDETDDKNDKEILEDDGWDSSENDTDEFDKPYRVDDDKTKTNLYELYLKGESMPSSYRNEHQKFVAARQYMHKLQETKNTQLMKEWTAARDHVNELRKTDPKQADKLSHEITQRFQRLYNAYEQEDIAEKQQIVALHQQHVQADLNQHKRVAMDKYMRALEKGDIGHIAKNLRQYIKAEEKDIMHTINHYSHVKQTNSAEAISIHSHVIQHLKLCQQRIEQALELLSRYPEIEKRVRPDIEDFMKKFDDTAARIRNIVLPDPATSNIQTDSDSAENSSQDKSDLHPHVMNEIIDNSNAKSNIIDDSEVVENEHKDEQKDNYAAKQLDSKIHIQQNMKSVAPTNAAQFGTTFGIAIGSVTIFVVLVIAVVMLRRRSSSRTSVTHGYVEVDPAASPEERHVANMQMNGYENPTYRYFEVQSQQ